VQAHGDWGVKTPGRVMGMFKQKEERSDAEQGKKPLQAKDRGKEEDRKQGE